MMSFMSLCAQVFDALSGLKRLEMTVDLLKKTKVGLSVNIIKKKYTSQKEINLLAKDIVQEWKRIYEISQRDSSSQSSETSTKPAPSRAEKSVSVSTEKSVPTAPPSSAELEKDLLVGLNTARKNVRFILLNELNRIFTIFSVFRSGGKAVC